MAKGNSEPSKYEIVDSALKNQTANVLKGKGVGATLGGTADAGLATTYGKKGDGKFDPKGYFGDWIKQNSQYQSLASELIAKGDYEAAEQLIGSDQYKKEIQPKALARQGLVLDANPGLEDKVKAGAKAQKEVGEKTRELIGNTEEFQKSIIDKINDYTG